MKLSNVKCKHAVRVFAVIAALNACGAVHRVSTAPLSLLFLQPHISSDVVINLCGQTWSGHVC